MQVVYPLRMMMYVFDAFKVRSTMLVVQLNGRIKVCSDGAPHLLACWNCSQYHALLNSQDVTPWPSTSNIESPLSIYCSLFKVQSAGEVAEMPSLTNNI